MAKTLIELQAERKAYVKAEAEKIANHMVDNNITTGKLSTCNARNWDTELHEAMPDIVNELDAMGIKTTSSVNFGVYDWIFTIK